MLRGSCTRGMHPHFDALPRAPRVVYRRNALSLLGNPAYFDGCVPLGCTSGLKLSRMLRGSRALGMHFQFLAIPHASRGSDPRYAQSV